MPVSSDTTRTGRSGTADRSPRRRMAATDLALVAAFAGVIVVLGMAGTWYPFGMVVPVTAQTLGVMLAGAVLGWRRGAASVLVVLALCAVGLPVLAGGRGGLAVFAGPTIGYQIGWVAGAAVVGLLVQRRLPQPPVWWLVLACLVGGVVVVYLCGIPGVAARTGVPLATAAKAALVFVPGDLIKVAVAAVVAGAVHRASPELTAPLGRRRR